MEILTVAEMESAERLSVEADGDTFVLMQRAGQAVAEVALALAPRGPILVVAGRGNNGGDGIYRGIRTGGARRGRSRDAALRSRVP